MKRYKRSMSGGFTLVELLVVIAIIGLLMGLSVSGVRKLMKAGRKAACINNLKQLHAGAMSYAQDHGSLPRSATEKAVTVELDEDGYAVVSSGQHRGWVDWYEDDVDQRTYWWGDKGMTCITNGTLYSYMGGDGAEALYVCPEHVRLARKERVKDCSGKSLSGTAGGSGGGGTFAPMAVRSYGMNDRLNGARANMSSGMSRTMLFAEQAFESQHESGFEQGYGLRYVSITDDAADEWSDEPIDDTSAEGTYRQRFYRSWDGAIDTSKEGETDGRVESVGEMHSREFKRPDGTVSRQGIVVFLDGHIETIDIRDTYRVATGDWGDD